MENNKYYVPSIEEFRVGFECEIEGDYDESEEYRWSDEVVECVTNVTKELLKRHCYRVKYLDREDIEELGFVLLKENEAAEFELSYEDELFYKKCNITENDKYLDVLFCFRQLIPNEGVHIVIYTKYNGWLKGYNKSIASFNGIIKNKSELKVLMNQLGISNK